MATAAFAQPGEGGREGRGGPPGGGRLLQTMALEPRRVFSRDQLMDRIYSDRRVVSDRTIDSHITKLRRKFADAKCNEEVIRSVYGAGYKLEQPL